MGEKETETEEVGKWEKGEEGVKGKIFWMAKETKEKEKIESGGKRSVPWSHEGGAKLLALRRKPTEPSGLWQACLPHVPFYSHLVHLGHGLSFSSFPAKPSNPLLPVWDPFLTAKLANLSWLTEHKAGSIQTQLIDLMPSSTAKWVWITKKP